MPDYRRSALRDIYRPSMGASGNLTPDERARMLALEDLADPMGEPDDDWDDQDRPMMEDETMLPGGRMVAIDDMGDRMTDDLWHKTLPSVARYHFEGVPGRDKQHARGRVYSPMGHEMDMHVGKQHGAPIPGYSDGSARDAAGAMMGEANADDEGMLRRIMERLRAGG